MNPTVPAVLPPDVVRAPSGRPAVILVRTGAGWTVLGAEAATGWVDASDPADGDVLTLVEAMSLADLVAAEHGVSPEPDRKARRAARNPAAGPVGIPEADAHDEQIAGLRRTVGQLEHALAARVSIERAIGVLAERHGTTPREAFEELRRRARSQGRPAQELAAEVLDGLPARAAVPGQRMAPAPAPPGPAVLPAPEPRPSGGGASARRVQRNPRRADGGGTAPGARR